MAVNFKILALNGGGIRGIFQAVYLSKIQDILDNNLYENFDLIAGTSTGAIVGASVALNIDINRVVDLYKQYGKDIFHSPVLAGLRGKPRYNQNILKDKLEEVFGNKQLRDAHTKLLITGVSVEQFKHRIFSNFIYENNQDDSLSISDVVLSSTAAPTYFSPVKPKKQERSYLDGGLWANSPSTLALLYANKYFKIPLNKIKLITIGTGEFPQGKNFEYFSKLRPLSIRAIRSTLDLIFNTQASFADQYAFEVLGNNYLKVNPHLDKNISFDDYATSILRLPSYAEEQFDQTYRKFVDLINDSKDEDFIVKREDLISDELIVASGLSAFIPSRKYYTKGRKDAGSISSYVSTAKKELMMISVNLMTGLPFEGLCEVFRKKLEGTSDFEITVSLLNPNLNYLMEGVAPIFEMTSSQLTSSIKKTTKNLIYFKSKLSAGSSTRFKIRYHNSIPFGSAIIIDHSLNSAKIQIETKPYKQPLNTSFAFEVIPSCNDSLFHAMLNGFLKLIKEGEEL